MLLEFRQELLSNVNRVHALVVLAFKHVIVDEIRLVHVFFEFVEHLFGSLRPRISILEETLGYPSNLDYLFFNVPEILLKNSLCNLLLNLQLSLHFTESLSKLELQITGLLLEVGSELVDLVLINPVLRCLLN